MRSKKKEVEYSWAKHDTLFWPDDIVDARKRMDPQKLADIFLNKKKYAPSNGRLQAASLKSLNDLARYIPHILLPLWREMVNHKKRDQAKTDDHVLIICTKHLLLSNSRGQFFSELFFHLTP